MNLQGSETEGTLMFAFKRGQTFPVDIKLQIMTILGIFLLSVFHDIGRELIPSAEKSAEILPKLIQNKVIQNKGILSFIQNTSK